MCLSECSFLQETERIKMQIFTDITDFYSVQETAVAIGKFDGVHRGHRVILDDLVKQKEDGLLACVFTFDPSPEIFFGLGDGKELSTRAEKRRLFQSAGVDILIEFPFTEEAARTEPEAFVRDILIKQLHTSYVAAGPDLSFGSHGKGNFILLQDLARHYRFDTRMIPKLTYEGVPISSTRIRQMIQEGRMEDAAACLGYPYRILDDVVHGTGIGKPVLGIPTMNQIPPAIKLLPPFGVYYSEVIVEGKTYKGMTNIGIKPTVSDEETPVAETCLYDFDGSLYGKVAETRLLTFRRPEQKFESVDALRAQMEKDMEAGRLYHGLT